MPDSITLYVLSVLFLATVIRSAFGFGEALVAVPLLVLRIPVTTAAPLAVLVSITVAGIIILQDWRHIHFRSAGGLLLATLFGIPLGLFLLTAANEHVLKLILALLLLLFSLYSLTARSKLHLEKDHPAWLLVCGFLAGILGGAFGMNGPPLAIYGALRRWSPQHFRATLQAYFLPASVLGLIGYALTGLWAVAVTRLYIFSLPVVLIAILIGRVINRRLKGDHFLTWIYLALVAIGLLLLVEA
jgi:uncharacterized membrane protein YfcA